MAKIPVRTMDYRSASDDAVNSVDVGAADVWHQFNNQLGIVLACSELLVLNDHDTHRDNLREIRIAAESALALLPRLRAEGS